MKGVAWIVPFAALVAACQSESTTQPVKPEHHSDSVHGAHALTLEKLFELGSKLKLPNTAFGGWTGTGHDYFATEGIGEHASLVVVDAASGKSHPFHDVARMEAALAGVPGIDGAKAKELARKPNFELSK